MNSPQQSFRILLGSNKDPRDIDDEHEKIGRIRAALKTVVEPLQVQDRLHFTRETCAKEQRDWLVVMLQGSKQMSLIEELETSLGAHGSMREIESQAVYRLVQLSLRNLQTLAGQATWTPWQFFELLQSGGARFDAQLANALTSDEKGIEVRAPDGSRMRASLASPPRRFTLGGHRDVVFQVDMVGTDKAKVILTKAERRALHAEARKLMLYWSPVLSPQTSEILSSEMRKGTWVAASTVLTVNRHGRVECLELSSLHSK